MTYNPNSPDTFDALVFLAKQLNNGHILPHEFRYQSFIWLAHARPETLELLAVALDQWATLEKRLIENELETPNE